jgi:hypothetical protein
MQFTDQELYGFSECMKRWIQEHPDKMAGLFTCIFSFRSVVLAFLTALGFGLLGPIAGELNAPKSLNYNISQHATNMAGSFATWIQSILGPIIVKSVFAILQSAAMGGYGLFYVKVFAFFNFQVCMAAVYRLLEDMRKCNDPSGCNGFQSTAGNNAC